MMARSWDEDETGGDGTVTGAREEGRSLQFQCLVLHCWSHRWVWNQPRVSRAGIPELKYSGALSCCRSSKSYLQ